MRLTFLTFIILFIAIGNMRSQCDCDQNVVMDFDGDLDEVFIDDFITTVDFTFSVWFRHPDVTGGQEDRIFGLSSPRLEVGLQNNGQLWSYDGTVRSWGSSLNGCVWHHVVLTKEGGTMSIYLDDVFIDDWSVDPNQTYGSPSGNGMKIGNWYTVANNSSNWNGQLDDFVILDYAVTAAEISDLNACDYSSFAGNIVAHWDWNNGNPNGNNINNDVAIDLTGNYPGEMRNFAYTGDESNYVVCEMDCLPPTCPPDYIAGSNGSLTGTETGIEHYETDGAIESTQTISSTAQVDYDSNLGITLDIGFCTVTGATFCAYIDGCDP